MFSIIQAAGWPIWFLLLASVISVALIIERFTALRRTKILPPGLLQRVVAEFRQGNVNEDSLKRLEAQSPLGTVFSAGLRNVKSSREVMKEAIKKVSYDFGELASISKGKMKSKTPSKTTKKVQK